MAKILAPRLAKFYQDDLATSDQGYFVKNDKLRFQNVSTVVLVIKA